MKIVFDGLIYYLQDNGGITRYIDGLINGFSQKDDCQVVVLLRKGENEKKFNERVEVIQINSTIYRRGKLRKYFSVWRDGLIMERFFRNNDFADAVFHYSYYTNYKNLKAKTVMTVHDMIHEKFPLFFNGLLNRLYIYNKKRSIKLADAIIAVSQQTKSDLVSLYGVDSKKITVIHHALDKTFRKLDKTYLLNFIKDKKLDKPFFVFVGKRGLYKNFSFLLEAFSAWKNKTNYYLCCLGGGDFSSKEKELLKKLEITDSVKIFPSVSADDLVSFYNYSLALIFPSLYEGFGFPLIEAMSCSTNVLASDISIFHEVGGDDIIYFDPKSIDSLLQAFDFVVKQNNIPDYSEILKRYTLDNLLSQTKEVYQSLL